MSREMKIGDIGVLQNLASSKHLNGIIAEIIGYNGDPYKGKMIPRDCDYGVWHPLPNSYGEFTGGVLKHQIRHLSDPDAKQRTEQEQELVT